MTDCYSGRAPERSPALPSGQCPRDCPTAAGQRPANITLRSEFMTLFTDVDPVRFGTCVMSPFYPFTSVRSWRLPVVGIILLVPFCL